MRATALWSNFVLLALASVAPAAQLDAVWTGGGGNWSSAGNWDIGQVPNNGADTFNAYVDQFDIFQASIATVDLNVTIDNLYVDFDDQVVVSDGNILQINQADLYNEGLVTVDSTGSPTYLVGGNFGLTIYGGGTVRLSGPGSTLTGDFWNLDNTIEGTGTIDAGLINAGTVQAGSGDTLLIDHTSGFGYLSNDVTGVLQALNGGLVILKNAQVFEGTLTTSGTGEIQVDDPVGAGFGSTTIGEFGGGVANTGTIIVKPNNVLFLQGTVTNSALIALEGDGLAGEAAYLAPGGFSGASLTGGGTVELRDASVFDNTSVIDGGFGPNNLSNIDNTIQGTGTIQGGLANAGTIQARNGDTLLIGGAFGATVNNTGGTMQALDGGVVLIDNATITGGTIATAGTGEVKVGDGLGIGGMASFVDVAITGTLVVDENAAATLEGTIANSGKIAIRTDAIVGIVAPASLTGGGTVEFVSSGAPDATLDAGFAPNNLTNVDNTIQGTGIITRDLVNQGTVQARNGDLLGFSSAQVDNTGGVIQALDGGEIGFMNGAVVGGTLTSTGTGRIFIDCGCLSGPGPGPTTFNNLTTSAMVDVEESAALIVSGTIVNTGVMAVNGSASNDAFLAASLAPASLTGGGIVQLNNDFNSTIDAGLGPNNLTNVDNTIQGTGTIERELRNMALVQANSGDMLLIGGAAGATIDNTGGTIRANDGGVVYLDNATIINGTLTTNGTGEIRVEDPITPGPTLATLDGVMNAGKLVVAPGSGLQITGSGNLTNQGTLVVNGAMAGNMVTNAVAAAILGTGDIQAAVENAGRVAPGNSPGTLTISSDFTQLSTGSLEIELGGLAQGTQYDLLNVTGTADLDGTLDIATFGGFIPSDGDVFTILTAGAVSGTFATVNSPNLDIFTVIYNADSVQLIAVPEPTSLVLLAIGLGALFYRRRHFRSAK